MRDLVSEYIVALIEIFAGIAILALLAKFTPVFMSSIR